MFLVNGFVRRVFLFFLIFITACQANANDRDQILSRFKHYREINKEFLSSKNIQEKNKIRKAFEKWVEEEYNPGLSKARSIICEKRDAELLKNFLKVMLDSTNSADEYPLIILGDLCMCAPDLVKDEISMFENEIDRNRLTKIAIYSLGYPLDRGSITKEELDLLIGRLESRNEKTDPAGASN